MKKIITFLISVALTVSLIPCYSFAEDSVLQYSEKKISTVNGLGIMNITDEAAAQSKLSRGEMAEIIYKIIEYPNLRYSQIPNSASGTVYEDVTGTTVQNHCIEYITQMGIMSGYGKTFGPNRPITTSEALVSVLNLLGYKPMADYNGGYTVGYMKAAAAIGISIKGSDGYATKGSVSELIYDVLDKEITAVNPLQKSGETILSLYMKADKIKGRVVGNDVTSLTGDSVRKKNEVQIDDTVLTTNDNTEYVQDYIGRDVECYCFNSESEYDGEIIFCSVSAKNTEIVIDMKDFVSYENGIVTYTDGASNKTRRISSNPFYIYNGCAVTSCRDSYFDYDQGYVRLIAHDGSEYDLMIIEGFKTWFVDKSYKKNNIYEIFNKLNQSEKMVIDPDDIGKTVKVLKEDGTAGKLSSITKDSVIDIMSNGDYIKILVSKKIEKNFNISGQNFAGDDRYVTDGSKKIHLSNDFVNSSVYAQYTNGQNYDIYINSFGKAAYITSAENSTSELVIGYLKSIKRDEDNESIVMKVVTDSKTEASYILTEKITFSDNTGKAENKRVKTYNNPIIENIICQLIRYRVDSDGKVDKIELALDQGITPETNDRLYTMAESVKSDSGLNYYADGTMGSIVFFDDSVRILNVPAEKSDISGYNIFSYKSLTHGYHNMKAYGTDKRSPLAAYVIYDGTASAVVTGESKKFVVTKKEFTLNDDDEPVIKLDGYDAQMYTNATYYIASDSDLAIKGALALPLAFDKTGATIDADKDYYEIDEGDVIIMNADGSNYITLAGIIFDADGSYDNTKYAERLAEKSAELDENFTYDETGILSGTIGYFTNGISNTNPFSSDSEGVKTVNNNVANQWAQGNSRYLLGYVYDVSGDYVTYTTYNLHEKSGELPKRDINGKFIVETRNMTKGRWAYINLSGKKIESGNLADGMDNLKTYKEYGTDCSRILLLSGSYATGYGYIINGNK